jgi:hypothetical protein
MRVRVRDRSRRALVPAALLSAMLFLAAMGAAPTAGASRRPGTRVTVALFGDSVTESLLVPNFLKEGLAPQLAQAESALGFVAGGAGLIPAAPYRWHFNKWAQFSVKPMPENGWLTIGYGAASAGIDGPSGYSAVATSPLATATATVSDPDLEILYTSSTVPCSFQVSSAGHTWTIQTYRSGPAIDTETPIVLPSGRHQLTIHGPSCGVLSFDGVDAESPVPAGQVQVEVNNLGHSGELPWVSFSPRVQESLVEQRYAISVFLYGYIAEVVGQPSQLTPYVSTMEARARIAREHGGACLIVAPTPIEAPKSTVTRVSRLDRTVARQAHCTYTTALTHLWSSPTAGENKGLVLVDGVHPSAKGYTLMDHALAPIITKMIRAHLRR